MTHSGPSRLGRKNVTGPGADGVSCSTAEMYHALPPTAGPWARQVPLLRSTRVRYDHIGELPLHRGLVLGISGTHDVAGFTLGVGSAPGSEAAAVQALHRRVDAVWRSGDTDRHASAESNLTLPSTGIGAMAASGCSCPDDRTSATAGPLVASSPRRSSRPAS
jgi:hypothetical protein